jgi:hypothetical protein
MLDACESIVDVIVDPRFMDLTARAIPHNVKYPRKQTFSFHSFRLPEYARMMQVEQLIEMQGFPTLLLTRYCIEITRKHFDIPISTATGGFNKESYTITERNYCEG